MFEATIYGKGKAEPGMPSVRIPESTRPVESRDTKGAGWHYHLPGDTDKLYTSSAVINSVLQPQVKMLWYSDPPRGPILKWVPASPPQPSVGYGGRTDMSQLDPRQPAPSADGVAPNAGKYPWSLVHSPLPWLIGMFIVGYLIMRYVSWGYKPDFSKPL